MSLGFIRSLALVVPVLGLISCTATKQPDTWQRKVHAEWIENRKVLTENLTALTAPTVPSDAKIIFDGADIESGTISSSCTSGSGDATAQSVQKSAKVVSSEVFVSTLLPSEIWKHFDWSAEAKVNCSFTFNVTNVNGSTWAFKVPTMTIKRLDQLVNLKLDAQWAQKLADGAVSSKNIDTLVTADLPATLSGPSSVNLLCEKFQNKHEFSQSTSIADASNAVLFGGLASQFGTIDGRDIYEKQFCQLMIETVDGIGNTARQLSEKFLVQFNAAPIEYEVTPFSLPHGEKVADEQGAKVLTIKVSNHSTVPQRFQIFGAQGKNIGLQFATAGVYPSTLDIMNDNFAHLEFTSVGATLVNDDKMNPIYEVAPGQIWNVSAQLTRDYHCFGSDSPLVFQNYSGTFYQFTAHALIGKVRQLTSGPAITEKVPLFAGEKSKLASGLNPGWAPSETLHSSADEFPTEAPKIYPVFKCAAKGVELSLFN